MLENNIYLPAVSQKITADISLHGSKSIANRVLLLAALTNGVSVIHNVPDSAEDVWLMLSALQSIGISIAKIVNQAKGNHSYAIIGCSGKIPVKSKKIFCGNSGTTIRFLTAILGIQDGQYYLTGVKRMQQRPINDLVNALLMIGAQVSYSNESGNNFINSTCPPLQISSLKYNGNIQIQVNSNTSSQYLSAILMAFTQLHVVDSLVPPVTVIAHQLISKPYIDITLELLAKFGADVIVEQPASQLEINYVIYPQILYPIEYTIEPDASSASYFLAIGAIGIMGGDITINNLGDDSIQGDKHFARVLEKMGAIVTYTKNSIRVQNHVLKAVEVNMQDMPDVAMTLAVVSLFAVGTTYINGISSWAVKETNRLQAMHTELTKLGASVIITGDSISITPPKFIKQNIIIDTYNDHRMAMAFSILAAGGIPVTINNPQCVAKTFADYFNKFCQICY